VSRKGVQTKSASVSERIALCVVGPGGGPPSVKPRRWCTPPLNNLEQNEALATGALRRHVLLHPTSAYAASAVYVLPAFAASVAGAAVPFAAFSPH